MKALKQSDIIKSSIDHKIDRFIFKEAVVHTEENHHVWKRLVSNVISCFKNYSTSIYPPFKEGFYSLNLDSFSIPDINILNQKLASIGWQAKYVKGFIPSHIYASMLANQLFPISYFIRPLKYFDYSVAPDFGHDVLGHLPMLFVEEFRTLLKKWAIKASQCKCTFLDDEAYRLTIELIEEKESADPDNLRISLLTKKLNNIYDQLVSSPSTLSVLAKFYSWSFEFGVIKVNNVPNIFGAAIISSFKEAQNICENNVALLEFNEDTLKTGANFTKLQEMFFYVNDFSTYFDYLDKISLEPNAIIT
ncbi:MAG: hypothetical protein WCP46_04805 [Alphaproteobacteria bacterium]